jgi:hypothetical protein
MSSYKMHYSLYYQTIQLTIITPRFDFFHDLSHSLYTVWKHVK